MNLGKDDAEKYYGLPGHESWWVLSPLGIWCRRILTWASLVSLACILGCYWSWDRSEYKVLGLIGLLPLFVPYVFIPLRLYGIRFKSGVTLALAMGSAVFIPGICLVRFALRWDRNPWIVVNLVAVLLMQAVLIVIAAKAFFSMPRVPHDRDRLQVSLFYAFSLFALFWLFYSPVPDYIRDNESSAIHHLDRCASNALLGFDSSESDCLIQSAVEPSKPSRGYVFAFSGSNSSTVDGRIRYKGFTITARPVVFGKTGIRSFVTTGEQTTIHATSENRPANERDPTVAVYDRSVLPLGQRPGPHKQ